jgi:hypothetical protein
MQQQYYFKKCSFISRGQEAKLPPAKSNNNNPNLHLSRRLSWRGYDTALFVSCIILCDNTILADSRRGVLLQIRNWGK